MGGRGSSSGTGPSLGGGSGKNVNIIDQLDIWSYRHNPNNEPMFEAIISGVRKMDDDFPGLMTDTVNSVNAATLGGADKQNTLGFYDPVAKTVALNDNYTDIDKMNKVYDASVASGYHPPRGNLTGTEAVTLHEMGHALTSHVADKMGVSNFDEASKRIVDAAYANSKGTGGTKAWAGKISGYAQSSNAECIAEAVADWYCNGAKASSQSKAIMAELKKYR